MITDNLFQEILIAPHRECDELKIISGYGSPAMAHRHLESISSNIKINLILGMVASDGVGKASHKGFQNLINSNNNFKCNYLTTLPPVHSKSYVWLKDNQPKYAFTGSGNYSQNAFFGGSIESFANDNPIECNNFFDSLLPISLSCNDPTITQRIRIFDEISRARLSVASPSQVLNTPSPLNLNLVSHQLTLLSSRDGETHRQSGLNWGQRQGREHNQAYIPVPAYIAQSGFFPTRGSHFTILTDDGFSFDCVIAQDGSKAIHTHQNNSILGKYFRNRIGLAPGSYVHRTDLESYGRTDVTVTKIDEETYFLDFSV